MIRQLRDTAGWILTRFNKSYAIIGSFLTAFNFIGIIALLLQSYIEIPMIILIPTLVFFTIGGILLFGIIVFDKGNFQTTMMEHNGQLDDYWKTKLSPIQVKAYSLFVEMNMAVINNDKKTLHKIKEKLDKGKL